MSLLGIIVLIVAIGLIVKFAGLDNRVNTLIVVVVAVFVLFWLLKHFSMLNALGL